MENHTENSLRVAVADFPPVVSIQGKKYSGFEIELWEAIAKEAGFTYAYERHNFPDVIPLIAAKKVDVGLAGITINAKREKIIDFSHPTLDSGLLMLVNKNNNQLKFFESAKFIWNEGEKIIAPAALAVVGFALVFAHLLMWAEAGAKTFSTTYFPAIFESLWLVICSMSTDSFGDYVPHTWAGRIVTTFIIVGGVAIFGLLIAQVSSFIALKKIKGKIEKPEDLKDMSVVTLTESTSALTLRKLGARATTVENVNDAYKKLSDAQCDAVVFDAPVIAAFVKDEEKNTAGLEVVGELFDKQKYGIALQSGSPLTEKINQALLTIRESGAYDVMYHKWFGEDTMME